MNAKIRRGIVILSQIKEFVPQETLRTLYYSFIQPFLDYNLFNWSSAHSTNLDCLRTSTKKAVRLILSTNKREHAQPLFKELEILPLDDYIKLKKGTFMWKTHNKLILTQISTHYHLQNSEILNRLYYGRYRSPNPRLEYAKIHITYSGPKLWNLEIPDELKKIPFSKQFKKEYQNYLLNSL